MMNLPSSNQDTNQDASRLAPVKKLLIISVLFTSLFLVYMMVSSSSIFSGDQKGWWAYTHKDYTQAAKQFNAFEWQAAAYYRAGNFKRAGQLYSALDSADGRFNLGNSLLMQGQYGAAIKAYEEALIMLPNWEDAETNLEIALIRAERVKQTGGEMTGGQLAADDIVFTKGGDKANQEQVEEQIIQSDLDQQSQREIWLRRVETKPSDFLRAKFSYQAAQTPVVYSSLPDNKNINQSEKSKNGSIESPPIDRGRP